jgi:hypothetical protein
MKPFGAALLAAALLALPLAQLAAEDQTTQGSAASYADSSSSPADGSATAGGDSAAAAAVDQSSPFLPGEQSIGLSLGLHIPALMQTAIGSSTSNLYLGGSFSFSYQYFIERGLAIGGNLAGAFNNTIGGLSVFTAPLGFTTSYWWSALPLEFSVLGEVGGYVSRYNSKGIIGPFAKAGGGAYWRVAPGWSVGLQGYYWLVPEIHSSTYQSLDALTGFVETSIGAVYHL